MIRHSMAGFALLLLVIVVGSPASTAAITVPPSNLDLITLPLNLPAKWITLTTSNSPVNRPCIENR
ncbi:hypothetical protein BH23CHL2_BH23CHL2_22920 [soil metagenome]